MPRLRLLKSILGWILTAVTAVTAVGAVPVAVSAKTHGPQKLARVPQGFVGMNVDGPLLDPTANVNLGRQLDQMVASGVETTRVAFNWAQAQPYQSLADVPADKRNQFTVIGGVPTNFAATDQVVGLAAQRGLAVLPTIIYTPGWDAKPNRHGLSTPAKSAPYAHYVTALVGRYGPRGTYWSEHPGVRRLPIRMWQIWNEPNLPYYWPQPFAASYVGLLRAAHAAIKAADPGAKVVLSALTNFAWTYLGQIYAIKGARGLFDVAAVNGFTKTPSDVIVFLQLVRHAMTHDGDARKPLLATEVSWPSAIGKTSQNYDFNTTEAGQAHNIAAVLPLLGSHRKQLGLLGFFYYTWVGQESSRAPAFNFSGLLRLQGGKLVAKPALAAFRSGALALERCRRKAAVATRCARAG